MVGLNGKEFIAGVPIVGGTKLSAEISQIESMDPSSLTKLLMDGNCFAFVLSAGEAALVPSGFVLVSVCSAGANVLRKSVTPSFEDTENPRVLACVHSVLESYPHLRESVWGSWRDIVDK